MIVNNNIQDVIKKRNELLRKAEDVTLSKEQRSLALAEANSFTDLVMSNARKIVNNLPVVKAIENFMFEQPVKKRKITKIFCVECGKQGQINTVSYEKKKEKYKIWRCTKCRKNLKR